MSPLHCTSFISRVGMNVIGEMNKVWRDAHYILQQSELATRKTRKESLKKHVDESARLKIMCFSSQEKLFTNV